jgi:hypothetical protein
MKKILIPVIIAAVAFTMTGCDDSTPTPTPATTSAGASKSFTNVTFNKTYQWFSTEGSSSATMDSATAKMSANTSTLDIAYTYDMGYDEPGFLDLVTRSSNAYYWSPTFYTPWSSVSHQVIWYETSFSGYPPAEWTAASADQSKIGIYFADPAKVFIADGHPIWPDGACIGGRNAVAVMSAYKVFGFKRTSDGKRGFIKINSLPTFGINTNTAVDIIVEH